MKKYVSRFHYITQDLPDRSHALQAEIACENGANWIQYRCLNKSDDELIPEINEVAAICDEWGTTLVLTNHYHLLHKVDAQGVHIEDLNADLKAIREHIGDDKTLGVSATDIEGLQQLQASGIVDYCGYGPFAHTTTKPNNFKLLGYDGYRQLQQKKIDIPVIAVGGITLADVKPLLATGIYGIAVCSAINAAPNPGSAVKAFYYSLY